MPLLRAGVLALVGVVLAMPSDKEVAEELDARRLIGKAYYENAETPPQFIPAADEFRRCIALAPDSAVDRFNLGLTLMRAEKFEQALVTLKEARDRDPELLAAAYVMGIVYKRLARPQEALQCLEEVTARDSECVGAYYNLGVCYKFLKEQEKAVAAFKKAVELRPTHPSYHYQLMILYRNMGQVDNVKRHKEVFDLVRGSIDESEKTAEALERSRYSYILDAPRQTRDLVPQPGAKVRFVDVTARAGLAAPMKTAAPPLLPGKFRKDEYREEDARDLYVPAVGGAVSLGDFDSDGDLDIYVVNCSANAEASANQLYSNQGNWQFDDVTESFGVGDTHMGMAAIFGDFDHDDGGSVELEDENLDLYVVNYGPNVLYRKQGHGAFQLDGLQAETDYGIAVVELEGPLSEGFEVEADVESLEAAERYNNAYIVFDYSGPDDFKFAGTDMTTGQWVIGHYNGSWVNDASLDEGLILGEVYTLRLRVLGHTVTLLRKKTGNWIEKVSYDYAEPLNAGAVGLAGRHSIARFDNVLIRKLSGPNAASDATVALVYQEKFKDGVADQFREVTGTWSVVEWKYDDISEQANVQEPQFGRKAVFLDYDHDYDLDIFVVNGVELAIVPEKETFALPADFGGQFNTLLRNNGNRTFSVQTDEAGLLVDCSQAHDVLFTDFDADTDTDLFVVNADAASVLFLNARGGKFEPGGSFSPPLETNGRAAAERDVNRDGHPDLFFAAGKNLYLYTNDGRANFTGTRLALPDALREKGVGRIDVWDYNNDGWADILLTGTEGRSLALMACAGPKQFHDVSAFVGLADAFEEIADLAIGDLDEDGDEDIALLMRRGGLRLLENQGGEKAHWMNVCLVGKKVNRGGYGALVEVASGGHYQKQTASNGWVHFGLGDLSSVDVLRVTWSNGQAQNVVNPPINTDVPFVQYVKVSASCGFLYTYNGTGFELVNEILGIGPLGVPMSPGVYYPLDNTELTKIDAHQLVPRDGFYELHLTEELREITYADQITLRVVDHPTELEVIPNEMFSSPPPEDKFFAVAERRAPVSAVDERGVDVLPLVLERDGRFPTFPLIEQYDGLAEPHSLVLDLGDLSKAEWIVLFLDSWIYWAESSVGIAIGQDPRYELAPLTLEIRDERGRWHQVIDSVGLPTSKELIIPVDLTGRFLCDDYHVRLSTNMRVYFDRIFVSTRDEAVRCRVTELPVARADLHYRGFSKMTRDEFGFERFDYHDVSPIGSWSPPAGFMTRYGDVTPLLDRPDDMYVIFGPGDELSMRFDATTLPELPAGWTRDFIFYADGWVKDGDLNTKFSETVTPLPFHGMSGYPYAPSEHYPDTPELRRYRETYNTRPGGCTTGTLISSGSSRP